MKYYLGSQAFLVMKGYQMTTQRQVRAAFWEAFPSASRKKGRDGDYLTDTRCAFVDYVDSLEKDGLISDALAHRVTL
jgi:hypothetical protein